MLGEGPGDNINDTVAGTEEKDLVLTLVKKRQNLLSLHYNVDSSYLLIVTKKISKFKFDIKNFNLAICLHMASISIEFGINESKEAFFKRNVYGFSVDF